MNRGTGSGSHLIARCSGSWRQLESLIRINSEWSATLKFKGHELPSTNYQVWTAKCERELSSMATNYERELSTINCERELSTVNCQLRVTLRAIVGLDHGGECRDFHLV